MMQWEKHGIRNIGSSYWLASREYTNFPYPYYDGTERFSIRIVDSYGYSSYATTISFKNSEFNEAFTNTFGVRPVITLDPNIMTSGKSGSAFNIDPYHKHTGDSSTKGGCYTTPVYHTHTGSSSGGGCYTVKRTGTRTEKCGGGGNCNSGPHGPDTSGQVYYVGSCSKCLAHLSRYGSSGYVSCSATKNVSYTYYDLGCGKTETTVERYELGCGKTETQ